MDKVLQDLINCCERHNAPKNNSINTKPLVLNHKQQTLLQGYYEAYKGSQYICLVMVR